MPRVTALRASGRDHVEVMLDGAPWRTIPLGVAVEARLTLDTNVDRERARELNRALRRHAALVAGLKALRWGAPSRAALDRRLSDRGMRQEPRTAALDRLGEVGILDDHRTAESRAWILAQRATGDAMIVADLQQRGFASDAIAAALAALEEEPVRAAAYVDRVGASVRTVRHLAARGFAEESLEPVIATLDTEA